MQDAEHLVIVSSRTLADLASHAELPQSLLDSVPRTCNYQSYESFSFWDLCYKRWVTSMTQEHLRQTLALKDHLAMRGLTRRARLGLTHRQFWALKQHVRLREF